MEKIKERTEIKLDKKDRQIMHELEENSRQSYTEIGKKVRLKSNTVEYRINKLIQSGIILRMFAEPNLAKLGLKTYRLYLKMENISSEKENEFIAYLKKHPKGQWFAALEGNWDYIMRYSLRDEIEFKKEIDELTKRFGDCMKSKNIAITIQQGYLPLNYLTGYRGTTRMQTLEEKTEDVDELDKGIMRELFENSRTSTVTIATRLGISPDAVQYRIKNLLRNGVISFFGAYYDPEKFGYTRYKILFWLKHITEDKEKEFIEYCVQHPNSAYLNRNVGEWDLEVDFDTVNVRDVHRIINEIRKRFPDIIKDYSILTILNEHVPNPFVDAVQRS
ncbi:MAG: Lrp/AsnC family transcriptional regulator [Candidatus Micrarchaeota archaeon]|nr:Lrp/AsnC family transcriptional regulator [Candidatus Micrarchaeota archaeon]